jgi:hypothetical protein
VRGCTGEGVHEMRAGVHTRAPGRAGAPVHPGCITDARVHEFT